MALNPGKLPRADEIGIDAPVMLFTLVVSVLTGLLFGLAPALHASTTDLHGMLKEGGRGSAGDRGGQGLRRMLVVAEVALALTLLTGAGLLVKSFARLQGVDPGFDPDASAHVQPVAPTRRAIRRTRSRSHSSTRCCPALAAVPGVRAVGGTSVMPFSGELVDGQLRDRGLPAAAEAAGPLGRHPDREPRLLRDPADPAPARTRCSASRIAPARRRVAVIDEEFVRRYWPNEDPIGKRITFGPPPGATDTSAREWIEVVGVVGHTKHEGLDAENRLQLYLPYRQQADAVPRPSPCAPRAIPAVRDATQIRRAVQSVDPDQPIAERPHDGRAHRASRSGSGGCRCCC